MRKLAHFMLRFVLFSVLLIQPKASACVQEAAEHALLLRTINAGVLLLRLGHLGRVAQVHLGHFVGHSLPAGGQGSIQVLQHL